MCVSTCVLHGHLLGLTTVVSLSLRDHPSQIIYKMQNNSALSIIMWGFTELHSTSLHRPVFVCNAEPDSRSAPTSSVET